MDYLAVHGCDLTGRTLVERRVGFDAQGRDVETCLADLAEAAARTIAELTDHGVTPAQHRPRRRRHSGT
ncbi:hypothetical protein AB0J72_12510 [Dactylosporangium sp. NPDC049742]|uniref:hypothetical protein n=1 Tax=Dactylosporangium sp. NPDC049742 TaxID=3154737 RepID=UPI0034175F03